MGLHKDTDGMIGEVMEDRFERPYIVSILVENRPGVLARVASLFSARGYNIEGLTAAHTKGPEMSRITCVTWGNPHTMELIIKQLRNLIEVVGVRHAPIGKGRLLAREMILLKIKASGQDRKKAVALARDLGARVISREKHALTLEATGDSPSVGRVLDAFREFQIIDIARSGPVVFVPRKGNRKGRTISSVGI